MKTNLFRKFFTFRIFVAWAVVALVFSFGVAGVVRAFAADPAPLKAYFFKSDYPVDDTVPEQVTPNLLFFFAADQFTTRGIVPSATDSRSLEQRAELLKNHTYGWGMRPVQFSSSPTLTADDEEKHFDYRKIGDDTFAFDKNFVNADGGLGFSAFGRDIVAENNIIGNEAHYYTPIPEFPYLLTFKNRLLAWHHWAGGKEDHPSFPSTDEGKAAQTSYNAIKEYMPGGTSADQPVPLDLANWHLVPNDSRTYILKLALKNVFDIRNAELLSRVKIGVAHRTKETFTINNVGGGNPIRGWGVAMESYDSSGTIKFREKLTVQGYVQRAVPGELNYFGSQAVSPHGIPSTGYYSDEYETRPDINGEKDPDGSGGGGVLKNRMRQWIGRQGYIDVVSPSTYVNVRGLGVRTLRAQLSVPFDEFYVRNGDSFQPTTNLTNLMSSINGIQKWHTTTDMGGLTSTTVLDDEITTIGEGIAAGISAAGIYGGRAGNPASYGSSGANRIYFEGRTHSRSNTGPPEYLGSGLTDQPYIQYGTTLTPRVLKYHSNTETKLKNYTIKELNAGQALGSIIDFFSPALATSAAGFDNAKGQGGLSFTGNEGFFPVTDSCQQNWVVIFTGGDDNLLGYKNADAVELLFKNTLTMRGREISADAPNGWAEKTFSMASGVRTIVVALLDEALVKADTAGGGPAVVQGIYNMAAWGDPKLITVSADPTIKNNWVSNDMAKPYFLTDSDQLMEALNFILRRVVAGDMGSGAPVSLEGANADGSRTVLNASFKMNGSDQWNAYLKRTDFDKDGKQISSGDIPWEADAKMRDAASKTPNARKLYTWISGEDPTKITSGLLSSNAGVSTAAASFDAWLYSFDVSPKEPIGILGDIQHSNIMFINKPSAETLYLQTNRGFLHAIDYKTGAEKWAFVPPNIFEDRLKYLKFEEDVNDDLQFMPGDSKPMFLLHGKLTANDVLTGETILTGYLGRGGNGFYVMNVTDPGTPNFLWAVENTDYGDGSTVVKKWPATAMVGNFSKLGLTIVPGVLLTKKLSVGEQSVVALPGGLGHNMGKVTTDKQGKFLYFFDPINGTILHTIELDGMGITPITYQEGKYVAGSKLKYTQSFYTADSEGYIYFCDLSDETKTINLTSVEKIFRLTTTNGLSPDVIPHAMITARSEVGHRWVFGGTANIAGPGSKSLISDDRTIVNEEQFYFGLNVNNLSEDTTNTNKTTSILRPQRYYADGIVPAYNVAVPFPDPEPEVLVNHKTKGWYLKLRPAVTVGMRATDPEYVSAPPYLFNGYLFVATFIPYSDSDESGKPCGKEDIGVAKIYMLSPTTGIPITWKVPAASMLNVKVVGFSGTGDRLDVSVQELTSGALVAGTRDFEQEGMEPKVEVPWSVFSIKTPAPAKLPDIPIDKPYIEYWREDFN